MRDDDAIAPVIAVMLILVVIVTLLSVYNATYLPGLKQSAEVSHLHDVEEAILKFGSDVETAASLKRNISLSQQVPLGGGDILLNSLKSGGSLRVQQDDDPYLTISIGGEPPVDLFLVNFSYWTVNNFWVEQAYTWQYGYVNVSRVSGFRMVNSTPLQYASMDKVDSSAFGNTLFMITDEPGKTVIEVVNFTAGDKRFSSGNGVGMLKLSADTEVRQYPNATFNFVIPDTPLKLLDPGEMGPVDLTLRLTKIRVEAY